MPSKKQQEPLLKKCPQVVAIRPEHSGYISIILWIFVHNVQDNFLFMVFH